MLARLNVSQQLMSLHEFRSSTKILPPAPVNQFRRVGVAFEFIRVLRLHARAMFYHEPRQGISACAVLSHRDAFQAPRRAPLLSSLRTSAYHGALPLRKRSVHICRLTFWQAALRSTLNDAGPPYSQRQFADGKKNVRDSFQ